MIRLAVVVAALAAATLPAAPAGAAVRSEFFGIVQGTSLDNRDLQGLARARIRTDRFMLNWGWVQPRSQDSFNWAGPDRLIGALAAHGVRAVPAFWGNPGWVYGAPARPPLARPRDVQAWRAFLRAAVARYGPGGTFWTTRYRQLHGPKATPLPITSWQIWNEPNLKKYFAPYPSAVRYADLLRVSHDAIRGQDPGAQVVLAGMPGYGDISASQLLSRLYAVPGIRRQFDAAAIHPYARDLDHYARQIQRFRAVMTNHHDAATPLWVSEIAWGSALPDKFGINKGPMGQAQMLRGAFKLILNHRAAWNIQRLFWFHWRDPAAGRAGACSFCASSGMLTHGRGVKPAYGALMGFTAETTPPKASILAGPDPGSLINHATPSFRFASNEPGSTFQCRFDAGAYLPCPSPFRSTAALADGAHTFSVRAIDAPGNVSLPISRSFRVDTVAPTVSISSGPANGSISSNASPSFRFSAHEPGVSYRCRLDSGDLEVCSSPYTTGGLASGPHTFSVTATDLAGNTSVATVRAWTVDSAAPTVRLSFGPTDGSISSNPSPSFKFAADETGARLQCRLDSSRYSACSSPHAVGPLADGTHVFGVRATDRAHNRSAPLKVRFRIDTVAPKLAIKGPLTLKTRKRRASAVFALTASERVGRRCRIASAQPDPCFARYRTPKLGDGPHTLKVRATDRAGNVAIRRKRFRVVADAGKPDDAAQRPGRRPGGMLGEVVGG